MVGFWPVSGSLRAAGPADLALPLGELSPKVTERACRGEGSVYSPHSIQNVRGHSIHIAQRVSGGAHVPRRRSSEIPRYTAAGARALPRPNLLGLTRAAEDVSPYKRPPKILPFPVGRGPCLATVVPADSRPLTRPTAGALPRNRLASSAAGGASAISPACISYQNLLKSLKSFL